MELEGDTFWIDYVDPFLLVTELWAPFSFEQWYDENAPILDEVRKQAAIERVIQALARGGKVAIRWPESCQK